MGRWTAKLNQAQIGQIRDAMRVRHALHPKKLAQRHGVTTRTVYQIAQGNYAKRLGGNGCG